MLLSLEHINSSDYVIWLLRIYLLGLLVSNCLLFSVSKVFCSFCPVSMKTDQGRLGLVCCKLWVLVWRSLLTTWKSQAGRNSVHTTLTAGDNMHVHSFLVIRLRRPFQRTESTRGAGKSCASVRKPVWDYAFHLCVRLRTFLSSAPFSHPCFSLRRRKRHII